MKHVTLRGFIASSLLVASFVFDKQFGLRRVSSLQKRFTIGLEFLRGLRHMDIQRTRNDRRELAINSVKYMYCTYSSKISYTIV
jgi:hypothetical protein